MLGNTPNAGGRCLSRINEDGEACRGELEDKIFVDGATYLGPWEGQYAPCGFYSDERIRKPRAPVL